MSHTRALLLAAVGAGALYLLGAVALGTPPSASDTPHHVAAWFAEHGGAARTYAWTSTLGTLSFATTAALLARTLPPLSRDVFLLGAAAFVVETAVQAWCWAALALHPAQIAPSDARLLLDVASYWGPLLTGATTTMIGAVTVLGLRRRPTIPAWLTALGIVAFLEQVAETVTVFGKTGFLAPGGAMNTLLGAGLTALWLAGLVVWSARRLTREAARQTQPA